MARRPVAISAISVMPRDAAVAFSAATAVSASPGTFPTVATFTNGRARSSAISLDASRSSSVGVGHATRTHALRTASGRAASSVNARPGSSIRAGRSWCYTGLGLASLLASGSHASSLPRTWLHSWTGSDARLRARPDSLLRRDRLSSLWCRLHSAGGRGRVTRSHSLAGDLSRGSRELASERPSTWSCSVARYLPGGSGELTAVRPSARSYPGTWDLPGGSRELTAEGSSAWSHFGAYARPTEASSARSAKSPAARSHPGSSSARSQSGASATTSTTLG